MAISLVGKGKAKEGFIDFAPYLHKIRHKLIWCLIVLVAAAAASYVLTRFMSSRYTATATVLFKAQSADVTPLPRVENYDSTRSDYYETKYAQMSSRVVLETAVKVMKLDQDPEFSGGNDQDEATRTDNAIRYLQRNLAVSGVRSTQMVAVSMEASSPQKAADVANGVAQAFISYSLQQKQKTLLQAQQWNEKMMADLKNKMVKQQADIDAWLKQQGLLTFRGVDGYETEQLGIVTNRLADATQRRLEAETTWDKIRRQQGKPAEQVISLPEISGHPQIQDLRIALTQARRDVSEAAKHYGPQHPKYLQAQAQLQAVNSQIGQVLGELQNGLRQKYQIARDDEQRYQKMLDDQKVNFQQLAGKRDHYNTLMTALNKTTDLYKSLYQRANEQKLSESFSVADEQIYDPATPPLKASKPNRGMLIVMITLMSLGLYVMYLIITTAMDKTVNSLSELKNKAGLEASGEFPLLLLESKARRLISDVLYADMIHSLRMTLEAQIPVPVRLMVTAVKQGDGSTLMAQLLAHSASKSHKTLLIDLDYLSAEPLSAQKHGFASCLNGECSPEQAVVSLADNLDLLPRGDLHDSSLLLLTSERLPALLDSLQQQWQTLIINTPSLGLAQDCQLLQRHTHVTLLIAKAGEQASTIASCHARLSNSPGHSVALALNQVQEANLESLEGQRLVERGTGELLSPKHLS